MSRKTQRRLRNIILAIIVVIFAGSLVIPAATQADASESIGATTTSLPLSAAATIWR